MGTRVSQPVLPTGPSYSVYNVAEIFNGPAEVLGFDRVLLPWKRSLAPAESLLSFISRMVKCIEANSFTFLNCIT